MRGWIGMKAEFLSFWIVNVTFDHFCGIGLVGKLQGTNITIGAIKCVGDVGWAKFGILPYLDLNAWAEIEGVKIPNRVMADAIFPVGEGGEEVVRKTTQKIAYEILTESHLNKLAALAAQEISERDSD